MNAIETINAFYEAIKAKAANDITQYYVPNKELYVVLEGPRLTNRGFGNIAKGWTDFCGSGLRLEKIEWQEGPFSEEHATMAWVGGVVELTVAVNEKTFTRVFRASFVLTGTPENWRIQHEHVSAALEDPYGIGDWLKSSA